MVWNPIEGIRKRLAKRPAAEEVAKAPSGPGKLDPDSQAAFEGSFARNREALEELAKH